MRDKEKHGCGPKWGWARKSGGPGWSTPPWARFSNAGPDGFGGRRGGRMFGQGDLRLLLLALVADKPSHGYDLIRTIEARFNGSYAPSAGTIYPTLTLLEEQELIEAESDGGPKKSYRATAKGQEFLEENAEAVMALMQRIEAMAESGGGPPSPSVMQAIHALRSAIMSKSGASEGEQDRIRTIIEKATGDILGRK